MISSGEATSTYGPVPQSQSEYILFSGAFQFFRYRIIIFISPMPTSVVSCQFLQFPFTAYSQTILVTLLQIYLSFSESHLMRKTQRVLTPTLQVCSNIIYCTCRFAAEQVLGPQYKIFELLSHFWLTLHIYHLGFWVFPPEL